jgi:hypothetical protein
VEDGEPRHWYQLAHATQPGIAILAGAQRESIPGCPDAVPGCPYISLGDLDHDGVKETYRTCLTQEGEYHTIWSGAPLTGRRVFKGYRALEYDTESTCEPADYESPEGETGGE